MASVEELSDREYLERYAGLADNVATIIHDREGLDLTQEQIDAIIRANLQAVYDIFGRDIDLIEELIEKGEWTTDG